MTDYCDKRDLYDFGLPRGGIANPARVLHPQGTADPTADTLTLNQHGFETGDLVRFRAEGGGSMAAPLVAYTPYYAIEVDQDRFQVSATIGGPAIDLTTAGSRMVVWFELPVDASITYASRQLDEMLPAHVVPLELPVPPIVKMTAAELAVAKLASRGGFQSKSLGDVLVEAQKRMTRWAAGVPLRGENAPTTHTNNAAVAAAALDPTGWKCFGGI